MPKFAANLTYLFQELPLMKRFEAAKNHGFRAVECQFPYGYNYQLIRKILKKKDLRMLLINAPAGNWEKGDRGLAVIPGKEVEFQRTVQVAAKVAQKLAASHIHVMVGRLPRKVNRKDGLKTLITNLEKAADIFNNHKQNLLLEPLNPNDFPEYFLTELSDSLEIIDTINKPNVFLQLDIYHCLMRGDDPFKIIRENLNVISHMQIADCPGRHEPGSGNGKIDFLELFTLIDSLNYKGWIGCEYIPKKTTKGSFNWANAYGII
ncbi:MAG: Hydroxypyruvate isomerase [Alphaproteobacteria bacterium MarineAlpha3_Bin5]|nr:MAG: Hydroxypyruvate isomerase [Alphaproteobacteria bacterium MarineAlpha3_Bin5]|tara:strand:+ start:238 stop:1026 length:789 start_codon:yes stop_codon:yes gene_type:complete